MESMAAGTVFVEGFEAPNVLSNWQLTGHTAFITEPRWSLVTTIDRYGLSHGGTKAMWFGDPSNGQYGGIGCDTCPVYSGTLTYTAPPVFVPATERFAFLSFWSWEYTEMSALTGGHKDTCYGATTCRFDVRRVWISGTLAPTFTGWTKKWDTSLDSTVEQAWHRVSLSISEYKGQSIRMRFDFNTDPFPEDGSDGRNNDGRGWYVDDISLHTANIAVYLPVMRRN